MGYSSSPPEENIHRDRNDSKKFMDRGLRTGDAVSSTASGILSLNLFPPWPLGGLLICKNQNGTKNWLKLAMGSTTPDLPAPHTHSFVYSTYIYLAIMYFGLGNILSAVSRTANKKNKAPVIRADIPVGETNYK